LVMRTNDKGIRHELERLRIDEESYWSAAAGMRAYFATHGQPSIISPDLRIGLFVGQMSIDLAIVRDGRLASPVDFSDEIKQWARQVDLLLIRPHPAQSDTRHLYPLLEGVPNALLVNENTYSLLCASNLAFVGAISSGVLKEATYLGCGDVRRLMVDDRNNPSLLPESCSPWIPVGLDVASAGTLMRFSRARKNSWRWPLTISEKRSKPVFTEDMLNPIFGYRWGLDSAAKGLPQFPTLVPGGRMNFSCDQPAAVCVIFGCGWHGLEDWGVWSAESHASLAIPTVFPEDDPLVTGWRFSLHGHIFVPENTTAPTIRIFVNGLECEALSEKNEELEWSVVFENKDARVKCFVVSVEVQGALRQCDLGGDKNDFRAFGLGLRYVALSEIKNDACHV